MYTKQSISNRHKSIDSLIKDLKAFYGFIDTACYVDTKKASSLLIALLRKKYDSGHSLPRIPKDVIHEFDRITAGYRFVTDELSLPDNTGIINPSDLGTVYESLRSAPDRRRMGVFYTPHTTVIQMVEQSLREFLKNTLTGVPSGRLKQMLNILFSMITESDGTINNTLNCTPQRKEVMQELDRALARVTICDMSVGAGGFLVMMALYISRMRFVLQNSFAGGSKISESSLLRHCIKRSLYGVDIDNTALGITTFRLQLQYEKACIAEGVDTEQLHFENFRNADALLINHNARFDIVIGNPPYEQISTTYKNNLLANANSSRLLHLVKGGKVNLYQLFYALSLKIVRQHGIVCLLVPASFLGDKANTQIRKETLRQTRIVSITVYAERDDKTSRLFHAAKMSTCIILLVNTNKPETFLFKRVGSAQFSSMVRMQPGQIEYFDPVHLAIPLMGKTDLKFLDNMQQHSAFRLREIARCYEGEINLTFHKQYIQPRIKNNSPMVKGAAVQKFHLVDNMSQGEVQYLDSSAYLADQNTPKSHHHKQPRIVMQGITGVNESTRLKMAIVETGTFCANSTNYILIKNYSYSIYTLLGILNSSVLNKYFALYSTNSNVNTYEIHNLPLPVVDTDSEMRINRHVRELVHNYHKLPQEQIIKLERTVDATVCDLYGVKITSLTE